MEPHMHVRSNLALKAFVGLLTCVAMACGPAADSTPSPTSDDSERRVQANYECGEVVTGRVLADADTEQTHGVAEYAYTIDLAERVATVEMLDAGGQPVAETTLAYEQVRDGTQWRFVADGLGDRVEDVARAHILPGVGMQMVTRRQWRGSTLDIDTVVGVTDAESRLRLSVPAHQPSTPPDDQPVDTLDGPAYVFDAWTAGGLDTSGIDGWAEQVGMGGAVDSPLLALVRDGFDRGTWKMAVTRHLYFCAAGEPMPERRQALETHGDGMETRTNFACSEDESIAQTQRTVSRGLDAVANIAGAAASPGVAAIQGVSGASISVDIGEGFTYGTNVSGGMSIIGGLATAAVIGSSTNGAAAVAIAAAAPFAFGLAGIAAGAYIAARVNDAFGDDIMRSMSDAMNDGGGSDSDGSGYGGGDSAGDPHLQTLDGLAYDFQAVGEFILAESADPLDPLDPFVVQVRQQPSQGSQCPNVSFNRAVATRVGDRRVALYPPGLVRIDGTRIDLPVGPTALGDAGMIVRTPGGDTIVRWADGTWLEVAASTGSVSLFASPERRGGLRGLLGNFNGDTADDIATAEGRRLDRPVDWLELHGAYADSWRITQGESLFDYADGESTDTFTDHSLPASAAGVDVLADDVRQQAEQICRDAGITDPSLLADCVLDVGCTGDAAYAADHARRDAPTEVLEVIEPIFLDGWTQQGDAANGNWEVQPDGRSVEQTQNGDPTFFVSQRDYFDTVIRGSFVTHDSDDDIMGFVFGYKQPLEVNGDATDTYDTYVLSWKGGTQSSGGFTAEEGLTLYHVAGQVTDISQVFWGSDPAAPQVKVLATETGEGFGWRRNREYRFALRYGSGGIQIAIDGRLVFDLADADIPVALEPGRFGFYNYSQSQVVYGDFSAASDTGQPIGGEHATAGGIELVDPPASVLLGDFEDEDYIRVFLERDSYDLPQAVTVESDGPGDYANTGNASLPTVDVPAGTTVRSYYVHYDSIAGSGNTEGRIRFPGRILGIIASTERIDASHATIGIDDLLTFYPTGSGAWGTETDTDSFQIDPDEHTLLLHMYTTGNVDQMRVLTEVPQ